MFPIFSTPVAESLLSFIDIAEPRVRQVLTHFTALAMTNPFNVKG